MAYRAAFRCIAGCPGEHPVNQPYYRCARCGGLLEVAHDLDALKAQSPAAWKKLFAERFMSTRWPYGSGVWGKKEWVAPHVDDENVVSMFEGGTNLFWAERYGRKLGLRELWIKLCGNSHTGSFKDLGMTVLVSTVKQMMAEGRDISAIACASTGDTSAALSAYAAAAGIRSIVILPRGKISTAQLVQPLSNGAAVLAVDTDFDGCMRLVSEITEREGVYLANSMNSLRLEGQKTVAIEIAQQFDWDVPDWVVIPGGNLGNVSALWAGFKMMMDLGLADRAPRICVAQSSRANPLYQSYQRGFERFEAVQAEKTHASAIQIGNPVSYTKAIRALEATGGRVEQASEAELADAAARADRAGMFSCPHTGVALAALEKLVADDTIRAGDRVVVISTASGLKFPEFKTQYHERTLERVPAPAHANSPIDLPNDVGTVRDAVRRILDMPLD